VSAHAFYDRVATAYQGHGAFYARLAGALIEQLPGGLSCRRVLEVGAGTGFATRALRARFPAAELVALEPSRAMLDLGRAAVPEAAWRAATLKDLDPGERFDLVFASASAHWFCAEDWRRLLAVRGRSTLALSLPASALAGRAGGLPSGNDLVARLVLRRRPTARWSAAVRARSLAIRQAAAVTTSDLALDETFPAPGDLAAALYTRGALLALFGEAAEEARQELASAGAPGPLVFRWPFALVVAPPLGKGERP